MPLVARPWILAAGALLAVLPVVLHLLARRPPGRVALPTARFLRPERRSQLRFRRTPTERPLLAVRVLWLLLVSAALAGVSWHPPRRGTTTVVLLDRGAGMDGAWAAARDSALARVVGTPGAVLWTFDTAAVREEAGSGSDAVPERSGAEARYAVALGALRSEAVRGGADSLEAVLVTRPRWAAWDPGLARHRGGAWPGRLTLVTVQDPAAPPRGESGPEGTTSTPWPRRADVRGDAAEAVVRALEALGIEAVAPRPGGGAAGNEAAVGDEEAAPTEEAPRAGPDRRAGLLRVHLGGAAPGGGAYPGADPEGGWVLVAGRALGAGADAGLAWAAAPWSREGAGAEGPAAMGIVLPDGSVVEAPPHGEGGRPADGARATLFREDGRPAAAVRPLGGGGCVAVIDAEPGASPLAGSPRLPDLLAAALAPCASAGEPSPTEGAVDPLDRAALRILEAPEGPDRVPAARLAGGGGAPLGPWLLGGALLLAVLEGVLARRRGPSGEALDAARVSRPFGAAAAPGSAAGSAPTAREGGGASGVGRIRLGGPAPPAAPTAADG